MIKIQMSFSGPDGKIITTEAEMKFAEPTKRDVLWIQSILDAVIEEVDRNLGDGIRSFSWSERA